MFIIPLECQTDMHSFAHPPSVFARLRQLNPVPSPRTRGCAWYVICWCVHRAFYWGCQVEDQEGQRLGGCWWWQFPPWGSGSSATGNNSSSCCYVGSQGLLHCQQARKGRNYTNCMTEITFLSKWSKNTLRNTNVMSGFYHTFSAFW